MHRCRTADGDSRRHTQGAARRQACPELVEGVYDGDRFRESQLVRRILPIIPPRSNRKVPVHLDYRRYPDSDCVERIIGKLKQQRRIAPRYDKTHLPLKSFLNLAASRL